MDAPKPQPLRAWWSLVGAYVVVTALLRADFFWLLDTDQVYRKGWVFALLGGLLEDVAVGSALAAIGMAVGGRGRAIARAVLFGLVALTAINLSVLAAMNVPADRLMLSYLADPFTAGAVQSPVAVWPSLLRIAVAVTAFWLGTRTRQVEALRSWPRAAGALAVAAILVPAAAWIADRDHRSRMVSHADGASWLYFQMFGRPFRLAPGTDPRRALLGPAATRGEQFVSDEYPLVRGSPHELCRLGLTTGGCAQDQDGDGAPLRLDCDDARADVHPGAADPPGDRLDQDCSGADSDPPDVLVLELESLPARVLAQTGGSGDDLVAPQLAALAQRLDARLFTRYESAGVQTAPAFVSAMCSLLPYFGPPVTRAFPRLGVRCLPAVLRERGFDTILVQNGSPAFDRQGAFAEHIGFSRVEGFEDIARAIGDARLGSKWGLPDEALFRRLLLLLRGRRRSDPPLFVTAQTITNHHPYAVPDPRFERFDPQGTIWDKVRNTSAYVDWALGEFARGLDRLAQQPGRRPLLVILSGDHGHGTGIHPGNVLPASHLFAENVHTPLVWWMPGHPERLRVIDSARLDDPASSIDLMPTLLGLLGVHTVHASMGRDLAVPAGDRDRRAFSENPLAGGLVRVRRPDLVVMARAVPARVWLFDAADLQEQADRSEGGADAARSAADEAIGAIMTASDLIRRDRVWSDGLLGTH
jgi:hypothetical protein